MRSQHIPGAEHLGDWDRSRNEGESQRNFGGQGSGAEHFRTGQQSAPQGYPESHYQYQAQRDHPGVEYFGGTGGYGGGRGEYSQSAQGQGAFGGQRGTYGAQSQGSQGNQGGQGGYGGGSWSRSEPEYRGQGGGYRQQEGFQSSGRQGSFSEENSGRFIQNDQERSHQNYESGQYGQSGQYGRGEHRETQSSQFGRGSFEEEPFRGQRQQQEHGWGETGRQYSGYPQNMGGVGGQQGRQHQQDFGHQYQNQNYGGQQQDFGRHEPGHLTHGYGERYYGGGQQHQQHQGFGQGNQSQGYSGGGYQGGTGGQPQSYRGAESGQFFREGSHQSSQQPSGGYGAWGAYQVGSQPGQGEQQRTRRAPKDYVRSDERIRELICENLSEHPSVDASDVTVNVSGGKVTLEGSVPQRRMKHEIEDLADSCWGVKEVDNRIRVEAFQESAFRTAGSGQGTQGHHQGTQGTPQGHQGTQGIPQATTHPSGQVSGLTGSTNTSASPTAASQGATNLSDMSATETGKGAASVAGTGTSTGPTATGKPAADQSKGK